MAVSAEVLSPWAKGHMALYDCLTDAVHRLKLSPPSDGDIDYLEIGSRDGDSLRAVIAAAGSLARAECIDTFGGYESGTDRGPDDGPRNLRESIPVGSVSALAIHVGDSHEMLRHLNALKAQAIATRFDLVLIDGCHNQEHAGTDMRLAWPLLRPGGIMVCDEWGKDDAPFLRETIRSFVVECGASIVSAFEDANNGAVALEKKA